jgi:hypothetical protein
VSRNQSTTAKIWKAAVSGRFDPNPQGPRECLPNDLSAAAEFVALPLERDGRDFIEACTSGRKSPRSYVRLVPTLASARTQRLRDGGLAWIWSSLQVQGFP